LILERIIVIGAGGAAKQIIAAVERDGKRHIVGLITPDLKSGEPFFGYRVLGDDDEVGALVARREIDAAVMAIGDNGRRAQVVHRLRESVPELRFASVIDPSAQVARGAMVGCGSTILAGAIIDSDVSLGEFTLINLAAVIAHDCKIGDFASLSAAAAVGGGSTIGAYTAIGLGVNITHGIAVGEHTVVGVGSTVIRSLPGHVVAYGSPARVMRSRQPGEPYM
jgi:sugar O-acyltransferase (sialic acid O-acetyltransferase NeuD family)